MPTALSTLYCTDEDVQNLLSREGVEVRVDDNADGFKDTFEDALLLRSRTYATTRIDLFCQPRYSGTELAKSWLVNEWASIIAARWLATRRANPCPSSLDDLYKETVEDMKAVKDYQLAIPSIGEATESGPAWSNITVDPSYRVAKSRVERSISEKSPTQYPQRLDYGSAFTIEP